MVSGDTLARMGFGDWSVVPFGLSILLNTFAVGGGMLVSHSTAPSQLVKLLPVVDYDEVPIKHVPWEPKWLLHLILMVIVMTVRSMVWDGWILRSALEHRKKESDKLRAFGSQLQSWFIRQELP